VKTERPSSVWKKNPGGVKGHKMRAAQYKFSLPGNAKESIPLTICVGQGKEEKGPLTAHPPKEPESTTQTQQGTHSGKIFKSGTAEVRRVREGEPETGFDRLTSPERQQPFLGRSPKNPHQGPSSKNFDGRGQVNKKTNVQKESAV